LQIGLLFPRKLDYPFPSHSWLQASNLTESNFNLTKGTNL
jgi:hypothetical protein